MLRYSVLSVLCLSLIIAAATPSSADSELVTVVRLTDGVEIAAPPATVWKTLTTGKSLVTWCPMWKSDANAKVDLTKVGDSLAFMDDWGNGGRSIVTYIDPDHELRVAHEPNDGSYMCQARVILEPSGDNGTALTYVEQYTDESSKEDREATTTQMQDEMAKTLASLKKLAETK